MKRGLNLDIWTTWPGEDQWGDRRAILPYPEWRKILDDGDLKALKSRRLRFPAHAGRSVAVPVRRDAGAARRALSPAVLDSVRMVNRAGLKVVVDMHLIPAGERPQDRHGRGDGRSANVRRAMSKWCARWRARWPRRIRRRSLSSR